MAFSGDGAAHWWRASRAVVGGRGTPFVAFLPLFFCRCFQGQTSRKLGSCRWSAGQAGAGSRCDGKWDPPAHGVCLLFSVACMWTQTPFPCQAQAR